MKAGKQSGFVADGYQRLEQGYRARIWAAARARYGADLAEANEKQRREIEQQMAREVEDELKRVMPDDALF